MGPRSLPNPSNADLRADFQRQLDQLRADNSKEHDEVKRLLQPLMPLVAAHDLALYGKGNEGGAMQHIDKLETDVVQTKLGAALGGLALLAGAVVAKIVGWV